MQQPQASKPLIQTVFNIPLEDFGKLQSRYQSLKIAQRAAAVLADAEPALQAAESVLQSLAEHPQTKQAFETIRKNAMLTGRMRCSEAKNMLLDPSDDFVASTRRKLAAWRKTLERLSRGEDVISEPKREYIPSHAPVAAAIAGITGIAYYLSVIQLALGELGKLDKARAPQYASSLAGIRRCATVISDYEHAAGLQALVH